MKWHAIRKFVIDAALKLTIWFKDVMEVGAKNVELGHMVNLCAYMKKRGKQAQAENIKERILIRFAKNRNEVEKMVEAKERSYSHAIY